MTYNAKNSKLTSSTGYLKNIKENIIYPNEIYLGIYDTKDNYVESTKEEYEEYLKSLEIEQEKKNKKRYSETL